MGNETLNEDGEIIREAMAPVRTAVTLTGTAIEALARRRTQGDQQSTHDDGQASARLASRLEALRAANRAGVHETLAADGWIDRASPEQIADLYQTTQVWRGQDPMLDADAETMSRMVFERYGVRLADHADRAALVAALHESATDLDAGDEAGAGAKRERERAGTALADVDELDRRLDLESGEGAGRETINDALDEREGERLVAYDSAERLEGEASRLRGAGLGEEAIANQALVEQSHATPAPSVVREGGPAARRDRKVPKARALKQARGAVRQRGLSR